MLEKDEVEFDAIPIDQELEYIDNLFADDRGTAEMLKRLVHTVTDVRQKQHQPPERPSPRTCTDQPAQPKPYAGPCLQHSRLVPLSRIPKPGIQSQRIPQKSGKQPPSKIARYGPTQLPKINKPPGIQPPSNVPNYAPNQPLGSGLPRRTGSAGLRIPSKKGLAQPTHIKPLTKAEITAAAKPGLNEALSATEVRKPSSRTAILKPTSAGVGVGRETRIQQPVPGRSGLPNINREIPQPSVGRVGFPTVSRTIPQPDRGGRAVPCSSIRRPSSSIRGPPREEDTVARIPQLGDGTSGIQAIRYRRSGLPQMGGPSLTSNRGSRIPAVGASKRNSALTGQRDRGIPQPSNYGPLGAEATGIRQVDGEKERGGIPQSGTPHSPRYGQQSSPGGRTVPQQMPQRHVQPMGAPSQLPDQGGHICPSVSKKIPPRAPYRRKDLDTDAFIAGAISRHPDLPSLPADYIPSPCPSTPKRQIGIPGWDSPERPLPSTPPLYQTPVPAHMLDRVEPPPFFDSPQTPASPPFTAADFMEGDDLFDFSMNDQDFPPSPPGTPPNQMIPMGWYSPRTSPAMSPGMHHMLSRLPQAQSRLCKRGRDRQGRGQYIAPTSQRDLLRSRIERSQRLMSEDMAAIDMQKPTRKQAPPPSMPMIAGSPPPEDRFGLPSRIQYSPLARFVKYDRYNELYPDIQESLVAPASPVISDVSVTPCVPTAAYVSAVTESQAVVRGSSRGRGIPIGRGAPGGRNVPGGRGLPGGRGASGGRGAIGGLGIRGIQGARPGTGARPRSGALAGIGGLGSVGSRATSGDRVPLGPRSAPPRNASGARAAASASVVQTRVTRSNSQTRITTRCPRQQ